MIHVIGRLNPDSDAIYTAAVTMHQFNLRGRQTTVWRLDGPDHETQFIFEHMGLTMSERLAFELTDRDIRLIDSTEPTQRPESLTESSVVGIIDHHRLGGLVVCLPPEVWVKPTDSSTTLLWQLMTEDERSQSSFSEAVILLGAVLGDTITLRLSTTTSDDHQAVNALAQEIGVDLDAFSRNLLLVKASMEGTSACELLQKDIKTLTIHGHSVYVAQLGLYALQQVDVVLDDLRQEIASYAEEKNAASVVPMLTDINLGDTSLWFAGPELLGIPQSCKVEGMPSCKKQVSSQLENYLKPRQQILFILCMGGKSTRGHTLQILPTGISGIFYTSGNIRWRHDIMANTVTADEVREQFLQAMSIIYQQEIPQYDTLLEPVVDVNLAALKNNPTLHEKLVDVDELARPNVERHGTIRVGTAQGLSTLHRMFIVMGMYPVSYYDLSQVGVLVHSAAFCPIDDALLPRNPLRVSTSLSRLELIKNVALWQKAIEIPAKRNISTRRCHELLDEFDTQGSFTTEQAREFVYETLETFRWHQHATTDGETCHTLHNKHRLITDVVCFPGRHIDHLTPWMLDTDRVQLMMPECGTESKILIEGSPHREVPILLHQTNFKAPEEPVLFVDEMRGIHTACFGEIEQRGVALTPKGRALYDELLNETGAGKDNLTHQPCLQGVFRTFPDSEFLLCQQGLVWFRYCLTPSDEAHRQVTHLDDDPQPFIRRGWLAAQPVTYEDLLLASAAGIFQSSLDNEAQARNHGSSSRDAFGQILGCAVYDESVSHQEA